MKRALQAIIFLCNVSVIYAQYCTPTVTGPQSGNLGITNVTLNTINCNSPTKQGYADSTHLVTGLVIGATYTFSMTVGDVGQCATFWIDYNRDNVFSNSEYYNVGTGLPTGIPVTVTFTIPGTALGGLTRMRVASDYLDDYPFGAPLFNPCGPQTSGDIEDYTINLLQADMVYDSCTTYQPPLTTCFKAPQVNKVILRIEVNARFTLNPLDVTQFNLNTTGTTNAAEISTARIWYTALSDTFRTTNLFGTIVPGGGAFAINGAQALMSGKNYFWLTYDIIPGATVGNFFDASCSSIIIDAISRTPTVQDPGAGFQIDPSLTTCNTKRTHQWYFGAAQGIDFNCIPPAPHPDAKNTMSEGSASISDANGDLLFYTNGKKVWNKLHLEMPNGNGLMAGSQSAQPAIIIPNPANANRYYIFTTPYYGWEGAVNGIHPANGPLSYSEVDMSLNNNYGDVVTSTKNSLLEDSIMQCISAVKNCDEKGYWIITHKYNSNRFYAYEITSTGVSAPVISPVGPLINYPIGPSASGHGQIKFSPNGKKLALAHLTSGNNVLLLCDFNSQTGVVSSPINLPLTTPGFGVSFSPDGTKLYAAGSHYNDNYLAQFNICATNIAASRVIINAAADIDEGMQLAPDGKIYCANRGDDSLHVIHNPNALGLACNFQKKAFDALGGFVLVAPGMMSARASGFSLTDIIQSDVISCNSKLSEHINFTADTVCFGKPTTFADISTTIPSCFSEARSYKWIFGDAAAGNADTSYQQNPTHIYSAPGNYIASLIIIEGCQEDTLSKLVVVQANPSANAGADQSVLGGTSVSLNATGGGTYSWSPSNGLSCVNCANPAASPNISTTYILTVTNDDGCTDTDTLFVDVLCSDLFAPNAFSPNNDGQNDFYFVQGNCFESFYLKIFDRWGNTIFETTDATNKWDGKYKNEILNTGSFMFTLNAVTYTGTQINKKGSIALVR